MLRERNKFLCQVSFYVVLYMVDILFNLYFHFDKESFANVKEVNVRISMSFIIVCSVSLVFFIILNTYLYVLSFKIITILRKDNQELNAIRIALMHTALFVIILIMCFHIFTIKPVLYYLIITGRVTECATWFTKIYGVLKVLKQLSHILYLGYMLLMIWYLAQSHEKNIQRIIACQAWCEESTRTKSLNDNLDISDAPDGEPAPFRSTGSFGRENNSLDCPILPQSLPESSSRIATSLQKSTIINTVFHSKDRSILRDRLLEDTIRYRKMGMTEIQ